MLERIGLSERSLELIKDFNEAGGEFNSPDGNFSSLMKWLSDENELGDSVPSIKSLEFLKTSLIASLLADLLSSLPGTASVADEKETSWSSIIQIVLISCAGTLVAACQGFDSAATMLSLFSLPAWVILVVGLAFALLSVAIFYSIDLIQASQILGVKLTDAPKALDMYLLQLNEIKAIRRKITTHLNPTQLTTDELAQLECIISMLQKRLAALMADCKQFDEALHSYPVKTAQFIFAGLIGLLFFGGGFFAGQTVALFILGLFMASVSATYLPVILFSALVGLAALSLYGYIQLSELNKPISRWFGLDENVIAKLCDVPDLIKQEDKLERLKSNIMGISKLKSEVPKIEQQEDEDELNLANAGRPGCYI